LRSKGFKVLYMYLFVIIELVIAAIFESVEIEIVLHSNSPIILLTWIPAVPVIYLLILLFRKMNGDEY
ncbi:MAG: hypothetical protein QXS30_00665, partial [Thermoplasmatales archaeon]